MEMNEAKNERVEQYLRNELNPGDKKAFEQELATDPELAEILDLSLQADDLIKMLSLQELEDVIKGEGQKEKPGGDSSSGNGGIIGGLLVLLMMAAGGLFVFFTGKEKGEASDLPIQHAAVVKTVPDKAADSSSVVRIPDSDPVSKDDSVKSAPAPSPATAQVQQPDVSFVDTTDLARNDGLTDEKYKPGNNFADPSKVLPAEQDESEKVTCDNMFKAGFSSVPTCKGKQEGNISVDVKGGVEPYRYRINNESFAEAPFFTGLAAGQYLITIVDSRNCRDSVSVSVSSLACPEPEAAFAPDQGQVFSFPLHQNPAGTVTIHAADGRTVYSAAIKKGDSWNGLDQYGQVLPADSYFYMIRTDSNDEISGYVTIVR